MNDGSAGGPGGSSDELEPVRAYFAQVQFEPYVNLATHNAYVNDLMRWADGRGTETLTWLQRTVVQTEIARHARRHEREEPAVLGRWADPGAPSPTEHYVVALAALLKQGSMDMTDAGEDAWELGFGLDSVDVIAGFDESLWGEIRRNVGRR